jgi:hypothetical protein
MKIVIFFYISSMETDWLISNYFYQ